jgi:spastin
MTAVQQQALQRLRDFHKLAKDTTTRAVEYDEKGRGSEKAALTHYLQALELIRDSLTIHLGKTGDASIDASVQSMEQELCQWHTSCVGRVKHLESTLKSGSRYNVNTNTPTKKKVVSRGGGAAAASKGSSRNNKAKDELKAMIENEIVDASPGVSWGDISGLEKAKQSLQEMVILPATRPDLFQGLRAPTRGLLLYGPPGNGKTLLAKAVATESSCTFLAISASTLTSKWVGEGEKLVRTLFEVASERAPSIIFIDEIDSVLSARSSNENEASRRLKTEFLIQFDGVNNNKGGAASSKNKNSSSQVFVIGATNRPDELDDAVRRRLAKRILIPLPDEVGRSRILTNLLQDQKCKITRREFDKVVSETNGYSASDLKELCHEAAMMAIREMSAAKLATVPEGALRPITGKDFAKALQTIKSSVSQDQLAQYDTFTKDFGTKS